MPFHIAIYAFQPFMLFTWPSTLFTILFYAFHIAMYASHTTKSHASQFAIYAFHLAINSFHMVRNAFHIAIHVYALHMAMFVFQDWHTTCMFFTLPSMLFMTIKAFHSFPTFLVCPKSELLLRNHLPCDVTFSCTCVP